jgi:hypothetical protein
MTGTALTFQGATSNTPATTLMVTISPATSGYTAALTFHRTDEPSPLDWSVLATVSLKIP